MVCFLGPLLSGWSKNVHVRARPANSTKPRKMEESQPRGCEGLWLMLLDSGCGFGVFGFGMLVEEEVGERFGCCISDAAWLSLLDSALPLRRLGEELNVGMGCVAPKRLAKFLLFSLERAGGAPVADRECGDEPGGCA